MRLKTGEEIRPVIAYQTIYETHQQRERYGKEAEHKAKEQLAKNMANLILNLPEITEEKTDKHGIRTTMFVVVLSEADYHKLMRDAQYQHGYSIIGGITCG